MYRKILLAIFLTLVVFAMSSFAAETGQELTTDYVARTQNEIN